MCDLFTEYWFFIRKYYYYFHLFDELKLWYRPIEWWEQFPGKEGDFPGNYSPSLILLIIIIIAFITHFLPSPSYHYTNSPSLFWTSYIKIIIHLTFAKGLLILFLLLLAVSKKSFLSWVINKQVGKEQVLEWEKWHISFKLIKSFSILIVILS